MTKFVFSPQFRRDIRSAARFYEGQQEGLGQDFRLEIEEALSRIADFPESGVVAANNRRRHTVRRFPYHIFYQLDDERILVLGVVHQRRRSR